MEKAMAPHSSTLAWKIPWTEEPGRLQSMGSLRVGHNWATSLSRFGEGNDNPLQCSCLENPRNGGAWWAAIYGVTQSWTRLKQLSSSSSRRSYVFILEKEPFCVTDGVCPLHWQANSYPLYYQGSPRSCICDTILSVGSTEFASGKEESSTIHLLFGLHDKLSVMVPLIEMRVTGVCLS